MTNNEHEYFERLINAQFEYVKSEIKDLKHDTEKILTQTTITNGRVTKLENWQSSESGKNEANDKSKDHINWIIVLLVSVFSSVGTIIATKLWH